MELERLESALSQAGFDLFRKNLEAYKAFGKKLILTRLWQRGEDIFGRKVESRTRGPRFGVYSYIYGQIKRAKGRRVDTFNLNFTGLFYRESFFDESFSMLLPPEKRKDMLSSRWFDYGYMASLSREEKEEVLSKYAHDAFSLIRKAF